LVEINIGSIETLISEQYSLGDYRDIADKFAVEIQEGRLRAGAKLPTQRDFAYERGIAVSTASRVYAELARRGLVVGEVGRGTFVAGATLKAVSQGEVHEDRIDLEFNFPTIPDQAGLIARALSGLQRADVAGSAVGPVTARHIDAARNAFTNFLGTRDWQPFRDALVFTGSGRQSIAAALSALVSVGGRLAVEVLSYPMIKSIAARLGASIVPVAMDDHGILPDALSRAHRRSAISAIYVQPVMHNPLGISMSASRRDEIVRLASKLGITIIEDLVYGFLSDLPPLASLAPERCIIVDSLSKRIAPGISVGILHVPSGLRERVWSTVRGSAWTVPPLSLDVGVRLVLDGAAAEIVTLKRRDARRRQAIVSKALGTYEFAADPASYHLWLKLPEGWRSDAFSDAFAAAAARAGVAVTPSSAFAMAPGHAPNAVRLALGLPSHDELRVATKRLADLLHGTPEDVDVTE
jgi:DNA-binding transcriptional MocR family regulator